MGKVTVMLQTKKGLIDIPLEKYAIMDDAMGITLDEVQSIGNALGVDWDRIDLNELLSGTILEMKEHNDVLRNDTTLGVKTALAHLREIPDYYRRLERMEAEAEADGAKEREEEISIPPIQDPHNQIRYEA